MNTKIQSQKSNFSLTQTWKYWSNFESRDLTIWFPHLSHNLPRANDNGTIITNSKLAGFENMIPAIYKEIRSWLSQLLPYNQNDIYG